MTSSVSGWGGGPWGSTYWGGGESTDLQLLSAVAVRENVVRLSFNHAPLLTKVLDPQDASSRYRYSITPDTATKGLDDEVCRPVLPVYAEVASVPLALGRAIDLWVDRAFTHHPSVYRVSVNNLFTIDGFPLDPAFTSATFFGLRRAFVPPKPDFVIPSRDIANPQTLQALLDPLPNPQDALLLGSIPTNADGDYAFDEGIVNLKKRIYRRLITVPGSFAHAPNYGVGIPLYLKRLGSLSVRESLAAEAERQIKLEPDVVACRCYTRTNPEKPNLVYFVVLVRTIAGQAFEFQTPFQAVA